MCSNDQIKIKNKLIEYLEALMTGAIYLHTTQDSQLKGMDIGVLCSDCVETFLLTAEVKMCRTKLNLAPCCFSQLPADCHSPVGTFISHHTRHRVYVMMRTGFRQQQTDIYLVLYRLLYLEHKTQTSGKFSVIHL